MDASVKFMLQEVMEGVGGASPEAINELLQNVDFELPEDYVTFVSHCNGGEGEVGENSWIVFFPVENLVATNKDYKPLMDDIPAYFLFGKDAADTGFAWHKIYKTYHSFGLMSNFETDFIEYCGKSFKEFIEYLYTR